MPFVTTMVERLTEPAAHETPTADPDLKPPALFTGPVTERLAVTDAEPTTFTTPVFLGVSVKSIFVSDPTAARLGPKPVPALPICK